MNEILLLDKGSWLIAFLASFLIWIMFGGLIVLWLIDGRIKKEQALHAFLAATFAWLVAEMLKTLIPSTRPFALNGYSPLTFTVPTDNSFPSSHEALSFAMASSIWLHDKKLGTAFVIGAILVGAGRVLANVHFVSDIVAGAGIGIIIALAVFKLHLHQLFSPKSKKS